MIKLAQYGKFDDSIERSVRDSLLAEFSEETWADNCGEWKLEDFGEVMDALDFARCQRPNGSYYPIASGLQCRKGTKAPDDETPKSVKQKKAHGPTDTVTRMAVAYDKLKEKKESSIKPETREKLSKLSPKQLEVLSKKKLTDSQKTALKDVKTEKATKPAKEVKSLKDAEEAGWKITRNTKDFDPFKAFEETKDELGSGAMGTAKLLYSPTGSTVIKKGILGENEIDAMKKLQGLSTVPDLVGAAVEPRYRPYNSDGPAMRLNVANGILATSRAKGDPIAAQYLDKDYETRAAVADNYIRARKSIHLRGVAHNDMHAENVFYAERSNAFQYPRDKKATMQVIDFGFAQLSHRAALLEALQTTRNDFQATEFLSTYGPRSKGDLAVDRLKQNERGVITKLEAAGVKDSVLSGKIRRSQSEIDKMFGKISEKDAEELLKELYDGI